jgi:tRNA (cmo5U34)-methyltransferase
MWLKSGLPTRVRVNEILLFPVLLRCCHHRIKHLGNHPSLIDEISTPIVMQDCGCQMEHIKRAFDDAAFRYDAQRKFVLPGMKEFYHATVWAAAGWEGECPKILDIGAGTGLLAALLLIRYPSAPLTLIDFSEPMLEKARERFSGRKNIRYIVGDYSSADLGGTYDLICSALSIHHLTHGDKKLLYRRIFDALNQEGVFVNADQVLGESPRIQKRFIEYWDDFIRDGPLSCEEYEEIRRRRDTLDKNEHLDLQLCWLRDSGFSDVDVIYKNRMFAVFTGRRK